MPFRDRTDAGRQLAERLQGRPFTSPVVLGLPRGGLPVAAEVAATLGATLDVFVARKIGAPGHEELAIGAVAEGLDEPLLSDIARGLRLGPDELRMLADRARGELARRVVSYRGNRSLPEMAGRDVVLVDDGMATGMTARAALRALRVHHPARLVLAVPVCPPDAPWRMAGEVDEMVYVEAPSEFWAVGQCYRDFTQVTDREVRALLDRAHAGTR